MTYRTLLTGLTGALLLAGACSAGAANVALQAPPRSPSASPSASPTPSPTPPVDRAALRLCRSDRVYFKQADRSFQAIGRTLHDSNGDRPDFEKVVADTQVLLDRVQARHVSASYGKTKKGIIRALTQVVDGYQAELISVSLAAAKAGQKQVNAGLKLESDIIYQIFNVDRACRAAAAGQPPPRT